MGRKVATYLLGVAMGIIVMLSINVFFSQPNDLEDKLVNLQSDYDKLLDEKMLLEKEHQEITSNTELEPKLDSEKDSENIEIKILVSDKDTHEQIAQNLVDQKIYPYKNDLMLILEMLEYDKVEAEKYLVDYGITSKHAIALKKYDEERIKIGEVLLKEKVIKNIDAFKKFQYILDENTKIIPGDKIFKQNSSLREIVDVLANNN